MISLPSLAAILGMAAATMLVKVLGLTLGARLPSTGFSAAFMRHVPGAVLAALVAPALASGNLAEAAAATATGLAFLVSRNLFAAMGAGVFTVYLARALLGA